ncbi:hypothetical protein P879_01442 [Paragonimus westermani]|uniref:Atos-like conserved domain-containing protein n=1 Tax=Paragonimus westermani TaxID=34504 RepID=A0A8T0DPK7_9TREM|nr:hypothetical protein P879_01442 [Paragonimus westermani]
MLKSKNSNSSQVSISQDLRNRFSDISCCSIGKFILAQYCRCYPNYVEQVDADLFHLKNSTHTDIHTSNRATKQPTDTDSCSILDILVLRENCNEHIDEEQIPVFICEQWVFKLTNTSSTVDRAQSVNDVQREIEHYFSSSPFSFWLKEHFQFKPFRLSHRVRTDHEDSSLLGVCFPMDSSQMDHMVSSVGRFSSVVQKKLSSHPHSQMSSDRHSASMGSWLKHAFSPIMIGSDKLLKLTVFAPERMPADSPDCPFCIPSSESPSLTPKRSNRVGASVEESRQPPVSESTDVTSLRGSNNENLASSPSSFVECSLDLKPLDENLNSPIVVMTDSRTNFFPESSHSAMYDMPFFPVVNFESATESATSTLTKKSRLVKASGTSVPLESPPRKQQRISAESNGLSSCSDLTVTTTVTSSLSHNRGATLDNVIAEFHQLNVERCEFDHLKQDWNHSSLNTTDCLPPEQFYLSTGKLPTSVQAPQSEPCVTRSLAKKREYTSNAPGLDSKNSMNSSSSESNYGHLPRERRRNATSTCVSQRDSILFFNRRTGLPLQSSPVPLKRSTSGKFDFDSSLSSLKPSQSSTSVYDQTKQNTHLDSSTCGNRSSEAALSTTLSNVQLRRRPASLRLNLPTENEQNGRHALPGRRRTCQTEVDQVEISCSAPPSGSRNSGLRSSGHDRMANTLGCSPVSHGSSQHLLVNFEESMLNGRIHPVGQVDGFTLELGASGSFFPAHERVPLKTYFFNLSDDNKPSPYLGYADLRHLRNGKGYHVPMKGSVQLTLFNPNKFVVKMFVIGYDFEDMPPNSQTFLRQRTVYVPIPKKPSLTEHSWTESNEEARSSSNEPSKVGDHLSATDLYWLSSKRCESELTTSSSCSSSSCSCSSLSSLSSACSSSSLASSQTVNSIGGRAEHSVCLRYLVHLRFHTTRSGRLYLHTDARLIFARDKFEFDPRVADYELRSFVHAPSNPRYSPKKWTKRQRTSVPFLPRFTSP